MKGVFQCFKRFFHNRSELGEEDFYPFRRDWYHDQIDDLSYDYTEYSGNRRENVNVTATVMIEKTFTICKSLFCKRDKI